MKTEHSRESLRSNRRIRITLDVSPEFVGRLEKLEKLMDSGTKANLIRQALQVFEYIAYKTAEGAEFREVTADGRESRQLVFLAPRIGRDD